MSGSFRGIDRGARGGPRGDRGGRGRGVQGDFAGQRGGGGFRGDHSPSRGRGDSGRGFSGPPRGGPQAIQIFSNPYPQTPRVANVENALHPPGQKPLRLDALKLAEGHPTRPGYGTRGIKVELTANYVELLPPSEMTLYRYDVQTSPDVTGRKRFRLVQLLLQSPEFSPHQNNIVTDFRSTIVSNTKLPYDDTVTDIKYRNEGEDEPRDGATTYKIRLQYTKPLNIAELTDYLNSSSLGRTIGDKHELIQALNIFLNHHAKASNSLVTIGSSKTFSLTQNATKADLGSGLEVIRGFFSSVRVATCRILVNINITHGAFYQRGPLARLMDVYGARNTVALERFLKLLRVQTTHLPEKRNKANEVIPRIKTIFGLARKDDGHRMTHPPRVRQHGAGAKDVEFWLDGDATSFGGSTAQAKGASEINQKAQTKSSLASAPGRYISVFDFFKRTYNRILQYPQFPLVNCGNRDNPMYLPAEVCTVLPGQPAKSKLNGSQTQQMIRHAVRKPWDNAASNAGEGVQAVGLDGTSNMQFHTFGFKISPNLTKIPGRILASPKVMYRGKVVDPRSGSWNIVDFKLSQPGSVGRWSTLIISLPSARDAFDLQSLSAVMNEFHQVLVRTGVNAPAPLPGMQLQLRDEDDAKLPEMLERAAKSLALIFIILPEANSPVYKRIKSFADKNYGIHTICSVGSKLAKERGRDQYMANVALKFNLKLGGTNQTVETKNLGIVNENKTMVVGIDVTHPSPGSSSSAPSVSAMVASVDKSLGQWPATLRIQPARQEDVDDLGEMLKSRLHLWRTKGNHAALPENILVYRDGVSEGQYDTVLSKELTQLRQACQQVYPAPDTARGLPRFTIIICGKRHKTRFYATAEKDCDRSGNTKPGTVVDRGVTEARNWDFFLQAHAALQGTARPCHYYIVHDEIFRQIYAKAVPAPFQNIADIVEDLTHNMCYLFGRATKAVSLCPPAYYADLACERTRCYLASWFDTPSHSLAPSATGASAAEGVRQAVTDDVRIHPNLKDTMFYI